MVGTVTGVVGAAGGLGGFVPPLLMGGVYSHYGTYAAGLVALAVVAAGCLTFTATWRGTGTPAPRVAAVGH